MFDQAPVYEALASAREALNGGDPRQAYHVVTNALLSEGSRPELCLAAAECLRWLDIRALAELYEAVANGPEDGRAVLELAQTILAMGDAPLAVTFAERAVELQPGVDSAAGLAALAWAANFQPEMGRALLSGRTVTAFNTRYVHAWCSLLCDQPDAVLEFLERTRSDLRRAPLPPHEQRPIEEWVEYLEQCLARLVSVDDAIPHVRVWHFIQYGSAVLDSSEYTDSAGGRFISAWQSYRDINTRIARLCDLLTALDRRPSVVLAPAGRDSQIVGRVTAERLAIRFATAADNDAAQPHALVVAAHGRELQALPIEVAHRAQTIVALDFDWLRPGPIVPDVCGMLSVSCTLPWQAETNVAQSALAAGQGSFPGETEVARRLHDAGEHVDPGAGAVLAFFRERAWDLTGHRSGQLRRRFRRDSPVRTASSWRPLV